VSAVLEAELEAELENASSLRDEDPPEKSGVAS
jgi:hypothetical protein